MVLGSVRPAVTLLWLLTVAVASAAAVFLVLGPGRPLPEDLFGGVSGAAWLTLALAFATVGALIVSRLPGHRVGWLMLLLVVVGLTPIGFVSAIAAAILVLVISILLTVRARSVPGTAAG